MKNSIFLSYISTACLRNAFTKATFWPNSFFYLNLDFNVLFSEYGGQLLSHSGSCENYRTRTLVLFYTWNLAIFVKPITIFNNKIINLLFISVRFLFHIEKWTGNFGTTDWNIFIHGKYNREGVQELILFLWQILNLTAISEYVTCVVSAFLDSNDILNFKY